jgi:hypothetical protein
VYFATPAVGEGLEGLRRLVQETGMIICHVYFNNRTQHIRLPHVKDLLPGHKVLLVYGQRDDYRPVLACTIVRAKKPAWNLDRRQRFDVFSDDLDEPTCQRLAGQGYTPDLKLGKFTGIAVGELHDLQRAACSIARPTAKRGTVDRRAIWKWEEVFPPPLPA